MCIMILSGIHPNVMVETGLDLTAETIGNAKYDDFFEEKKSVKENKFPGSPKCEFKGKKIPCLCIWIKKGSITSDILTDILETINHMEVFNWKDGATPFLLIYGHMSRMEVELLEYICNPAHEWALVTGLTYRTALWQVGDSPEQNGSYNMASVVRKRQIVM